MSCYANHANSMRSFGFVFFCMKCEKLLTVNKPVFYHMLGHMEQVCKLMCLTLAS